MNLLDQFKTFLFSQREKPSNLTVKNYHADVKQFIRWFEVEFQKQFSPSLITPQIIEIYKNNKQLSARSIERHLSSLRKFFHFLKIEGKISSSPFETSEVKNQKSEVDPYHLKDFKNHLYVYNASKLTIKNYIIDIKQFFRWLSEVAKIDEAFDIKEKNIFDKINNPILDEYKNRLMETGFSPLSVNRKLSSLRKYLHWATEEGLVKTGLDIATSVVKRQTLNDNDTGGQNVKEIILNKQYSRFPPLRLFQKISRGINFLFNAIFIEPLLLIYEGLQNIVWKIKGRPIFQSKIKDSKLQIENFKKEMYAPLTISTKYLPVHKKILFYLRHSRPKWYKSYHNYPITNYFHLAILIIFTSAVGFGIYQTFFAQTEKKAPVLAASSPLKIFSFQGRLTDASDTPIATAKLLRFIIYNNLTSSGSARLWEEVRSVSPDANGIFSIYLGSNTSGGNTGLCNGGDPPGTPATGNCAIPQKLFANNSTLWLGISVGNDSELSPRQQLATVAYATNAEVLQGMPPITDGAVTTNTNAILALNSSGTVSIAGTAVTTFQATNSQFTITGKPLVLQTNAGTGENIQIAPDGLGQIDLQKPIQNSSNYNNIPSAIGSVEIDDMLSVLATSSGQSAFTIDQNGAGPIISASVSGTAKFTVGNDGSGYFAGNVGIGTTDNSSLLQLGTGNLTLEEGMIQMANSQDLEFKNAAGTYKSAIFLSSNDVLTISNDGLNTAINALSGNVGIGTTSPSTFKLEIAGNIGPDADGRDLGSSSRYWNNLYINNIISPASGISGYLQRNIGALSPTNISDDFLLGATSTESAKFAILNMAEGNPTATISSNLSLVVPTGTNPSATFNILNGGILNFQTSLGGDDGLASRLYIVNSGNIGIGTTDPDRKLHVISSGTENQAIAVDNDDDGQSAIVFKSNGIDKWSIGHDLFDQTGEHNFFIYDEVNLASRLLIDSSGNIGIGTTSPSYVLDIKARSSVGAASFTDGGAGLPDLDDLTSGGTFIGASALNYRVQIDSELGGAGGVDTFKWSDDGGSTWDASNVDITGSAQTLNNGITVTFDATTGHDLDDYWDFSTTVTNPLAIQNATGTGSLYVGNDGNVGIGTTNPINKLKVVGSLCVKEDDAACAGSTAGTIYATNTTVQSADVAENYISSQNLEPGDVVTASSDNNNQAVKKSVSSYQKSILGIISTNPGVTLNSDAVTDSTHPNLYPVALAGRVPVKVSIENGPIEKGDALTSSSTPGVAMKATKAGPIIGKALEPYSGTIIGKIMAFVNVSWYDPDVYLTSTGDLSIQRLASSDSASSSASESQISNLKSQIYSLKLKTGETVERICMFAEIVVANLRAGFITAQEITTDSLTAATANIQELNTNSLAVATDSITIDGQTLKDYILNVISNSSLVIRNSEIISPIAEVDIVRTNLISPLASNPSISISLENDKLAILNGSSTSSAVVATIDNSGNASFSGTVSSQNLEVSNDASISGTLRAKNIIADTIEGLDASIARLRGNTQNSTQNNATDSASFDVQVPLGSALAIDIASYSGQLVSIDNFSANFGSFNQGLIALGPTSLNDVSVSGQFSIGGTLILADYSINALGGTLALQSLKQGDISIMDGLVYIDTQGNLKVGGNAEFAKDVAIRGKLAANIISPIPSSDLSVQNASGSAVLSINQTGDLISSGSGMFSKLNLNPVLPAFAISDTEAIATGSAGVATISANMTELTINNNLVTDKSLIYITPIGDTDNQVLYLLRQLAGISFTVGINNETIKEIPFNWMIVN